MVHVALLSLNVHMPTSELGMPRCLQVVRVAVLSLKNLLADEKLQLGPDMVEAGLPKVVQQRSNQVGLSYDPPLAKSGVQLSCPTWPTFCTPSACHAASSRALPSQMLGG